MTAGQPQNTTHDTPFDTSQPWGAYQLRGPAGAWLTVCHAIPPIPAGRRLAMWARHPLKHCLQGAVDQRIWGMKLRLMPRGNLSESRWLFLPRFVDRAERLFWQRHLPHDAIFLDIGANAGMYSFWVARCLGPDGRILAIEPDPELQRRLAFNRDQNHLANLELAAVALGSTPGNARLLNEPGNLGQNRIVDDSAETDGDTDPSPAGPTVPVRTLLDECQQRDITRIDGLKIDIEGREHEVMKQFFATAPPGMFPKWMQFERCTEAQANDMEALMAEVGYHRVATGRMNAIYALDQASELGTPDTADTTGATS